MPGEITYTVSIDVKNSNLKTGRSRTNRQDQQGSYADHFIAAVESTGTNLSIDQVRADFTGLVYLANHGAYDITWGRNDGGTQRDMGRIKKGEFAFFRLEDGETIRATSTSAASQDLEVLILER